MSIVIDSPLGIFVLPSHIGVEISNFHLQNQLDCAVYVIAVFFCCLSCAVLSYHSLDTFKSIRFGFEIYKGTSHKKGGLILDLGATKKLKRESLWWCG